jgi:hypothetical protein
MAVVIGSLRRSNAGVIQRTLTAAVPLLDLHTTMRPRRSYLFCALGLLPALLVACGARTTGLSVDDFASGGEGTGGDSSVDSLDPDTGLLDTGVDDTSIVDTEPVDTGVDTSLDTGVADTGTLDTGTLDTGRVDTGVLDTGRIDTGTSDSGFDSGLDSALDTGTLDSGRDTGTFDTGPPDVLGGFPAPHPPAPTAVSGGGPILSNARIVPIVFEGDAWSSDITKYVTTMTSPPSISWWTAVGGEYGIAQPTGSALITVREKPPVAITDDEIKVWLADKLDGTHADFGAPDPTAIYTIFYDYGTTITYVPGFDSCTQFGGYHEEVNVGSVTVAYAVMPRCPGFVPGATDFEGMTGAASHEWLEATSDPHGRSEPAYLFVDSDHLVWRAFPGAELGDMCEVESTAFFKSGFGYEVQRTWSNLAAAASHDPCVPPFSAPYFNSAPVLLDAVTIDFGDPSGPEPTKGVRIPVGSSRTIDIDLFSDAPTTGAWTVDAFDVFALLGMTPSLSFSFDKRTGRNGDVLHLTITVTGLGAGGGSEFMLRSSLGSIHHYWYGWVAN